MLAFGGHEPVVAGSEDGIDMPGVIRCREQGLSHGRRWIWWAAQARLTVRKRGTVQGDLAAARRAAARLS